MCVFFFFSQNPLVKMLVTIAVSLLGFGFCKGYRWYVLGQRDSLLQPPPDLLGGNIF